MFKFKRYIILIISLMVSTSQFCLSDNENRIIYPVNPSISEWRNLTFQERRNAMYVPEDILYKMSTDEVLQAWLDMPMLLDLLSYNDIQTGFDKSVMHYNVLSCLIEREDAGKTVLNRYLSEKPQLIYKNLEQNKRGYYRFEFAFIEILLSQNIILNKLSDLEKNNLVTKICTNHFKKLSVNKNGDSFWTMTGIVLLSRILKHEQYPEFMQMLKSHSLIDNYIEKGIFSKEISITNEDIISIAKNYISK